MKKFLFPLILLGALLISGMQTATAQDLVYVNSQEVLAVLPAVRQAESQLEAFQKQLQKQGQAMVAAFQAKVANLEAKVERGELSPAQQEQESRKLEVEQQNISNSEQDMVRQMEVRRSELLEPIYTRVNAAIEAVAKEKGYKMVFDQGVLLYGESYLDITPLVKAKLGI